jgi:hypothetical protein
MADESSEPPIPAEALELFWSRVREFVNVLIGYAVQASLDLPDAAAKAMRGEYVQFTCPNGYALGVIDAHKRVEFRKLSSVESALFLSATEHFERLCENCGCPPGEDGNMSGLRPPSPDDRHLRALREMAKIRLSAPAPLALPPPPFGKPPSNITPPASVPKPDSESRGGAREGDQNDPEYRWLSVTRAAKIAGVNTGAISRAVKNGELKSNGMTKHARRIDGVSLNGWILNRLNRPEPGESEEHVQRLVSKHVSDPAKGRRP